MIISKYKEKHMTSIPDKNSVNWKQEEISSVLLKTSTKKAWRRKWQPTPAFLPGKSHGQRSLAGYSPLGRTRDGHYHHKKRLLNGERLNTFPLISRTIQGLQVLATAIRQQFGLDRNKYICFMT